MVAWFVDIEMLITIGHVIHVASGIVQLRYVHIIQIDSFFADRKQAKSEHSTKNDSHFKPDKVYAQEFSHIIGMIHQLEPYFRGDKRYIPLLSVSQNYLSMLIAEYDSEYYKFLLTGDEERKPFLRVKEYGAWNLCDPAEVRISATAIL